MSEELREICAFILRERHGNISNLLLQKLLYFIQAGSLFYLGHSAFNDQIEAWQYGPVVPEAYKWFKYNKSELENTRITNEFDSSELANLVREILNSLGERKPFDLVDLTHTYSSWINAWNNGSQVITNEAILNCHRNLAQEQNGFIF